MTGFGDAERVPRLLVTSGYFRTLRARPAAGRCSSRMRIVRRRPGCRLCLTDLAAPLRGDPAVVGRTITLSGTTAAVVAC